MSFIVSLCHWVLDDKDYVSSYHELRFYCHEHTATHCNKDYVSSYQGLRI